MCVCVCVCVLNNLKPIHFDSRTLERFAATWDKI